MKKITFLLVLLTFQVVAKEAPTSTVNAHDLNISNDEIVTLIDKQDGKLELIESTIKGVKHSISVLEREAEISEKAFDKTTDIVSNQISVISNILSVFSLVFTLAAIIIGIYVTKVEKNIERIRIENEKLLENAEKIKNEVGEINNQIQSDISGLYSKLKQEETYQLALGLEKIPYNIHNMTDFLLVYPMEDNCYAPLKRAVFNADDSVMSGTQQRLALVIYQHFLEKAIYDSEYQELFLRELTYLISSSFEEELKTKLPVIIDAITKDELSKHFEMCIEMIFLGLNNCLTAKNTNQVLNILYEHLNGNFRTKAVQVANSRVKGTRVAKIFLSIVEDRDNKNSSESEPEIVL